MPPTGASGSSPIKHQVTDCVTLNEDRIEAVSHRRERVGCRHHRGMDTDRDARVVTLGELFDDRQQLDHVPESSRETDVDRRDRRDSFSVHLVGIDQCSECDRGENRGFRGGIVALDISARVCFRKPETLRLGEGRREVGSIFGHAGKDEVGGAVDDAEQSCQAVTCERLAQRPNNRDSTTDRCLEEQIDLVRVGMLEQLWPRCRNERLVR